MSSRAVLFGLAFERTTLDQAVEDIVSWGARRVRGLVVTPNVDHVLMVQRNPELARIYGEALARYADGMPIVWASRLAKDALPERVTGADLLEPVARRAAAQGLRLAFVGGQPGAAERVARRFEQAPGQCVALCPPFGFEKSQEENDRLVVALNAFKPDLLFLGVGAPKQEIWADAHLARLDVGPILCIGAALDFAAGHKRRAPAAFQRTGMEWAWRMMSEPRRLVPRYAKNIKFFPLAVREIRQGRRASGRT